MRARNRLASAALLIAATAAACAPMRPAPPPRRNIPLVRAVPVERGILLQACRIVAEQRGLEVQRIDLATGRITAFSPVDGSAGMTTRERWRFHVADGRVSVQMFLETRDGGAWRTSPYLHPAYDHNRERAHLDAIQSAVGGLAHGVTIPLVRH